MIAIRAAVLSGLVLMVVPGFGSGPKSEELEFYFTRLPYTDIYSRRARWPGRFSRVSSRGVDDRRVGRGQ